MIEGLGIIETEPGPDRPDLKGWYDTELGWPFQGSESLEKVLTHRVLTREAEICTLKLLLAKSEREHTQLRASILNLVVDYGN